MIELPLELFIHILSSFHVSDLIKLRAVSKKWRLVIDRYALLELNLFDYEHHVQDVFQKHNLIHSDLKNSIRYHKIKRQRDPIQNSAVSLERIKFLFRNARKLGISYCPFITDPLDEFVSEYYSLNNLGGRLHFNIWN